MLIVVAIYSGFTILLWVQTKRATEAMKISADAQVATVRAWLVARPVKWNPIPSLEDVKAKKWVPVQIELVNVGHTPATNTKMDSAQFIYHPNGTPDFEFSGCPDTPTPEADKPGFQQSMVVSPGGILSLSWVGTVPADQYDALSHGHATLFVTQCLWYNVVSSVKYGVTGYCGEWTYNGEMKVCRGKEGEIVR
jgi:hypothetical protein